MNDVPFGIDHNVAIMTILYLQQISNDRIGSHRFNEIAAGRLKFFRRFIAVLMQKIFVQPGIGLTTQLVT